MKKLLLTIFPIFIFCNYSASDTIPSENQLDWSNAGLLENSPTYADTVFQVNLMTGITWDDKLQNAISNAQSYIIQNPSRWAIIYFPSGTYNLYRQVYLNETHNNIIIQGSGSNGTGATTLNPSLPKISPKA
jgi:hypothetical protein